MPVLQSAGSTSSSGEDDDDRDLESGDTSVADPEIEKKIQALPPNPDVATVMNVFQADKIFDKGKLENDIAMEWEDILWFWRYPLGLIMIALHVMPLVQMLVLEDRKVSNMELILNGVFPLFVPLAFAAGYKAPILLSICENNYMYSSQEYKVACSWCNGCMVIFVMMLFALVAIQQYPYFFICACVDMFLLWVVTYRICVKSGKGNDRFAENAERAKTRRDLEAGGVLTPRRVTSPRALREQALSAKVAPRPQTMRK